MAILEGKARQWGMVWVVGGGIALCAGLVYLGFHLPELESATEVPVTFPLGAPAGAAEARVHTLHPMLELLKLVAAALMAMVVTAIHKRYHRDKLLPRSIEQAQILLCVAGAMMMIIIGSSVARALGIAGAASIIRFRTPVEDAKDTVILFLLLALGMACGLGMFAVAGLGAVFMGLFLWVLGHVGGPKPRAMTLEIIARGAEFPATHVQMVLAAWQAVYEQREVSRGHKGDEALVKYHCLLDQDVPLSVVSDQLMAGGAAGLKSVAWQLPKK